MPPAGTDAGGAPAAGGRTWRVVSVRSGSWRGAERRSVSADQVVLAAGTWGTQHLLHAMRERGLLPGLSPRLGHLTRTNSEALLGAQLPKVPAGADLSTGIAITSSFHPDAETHIENVRYGPGSNSMGLLKSVLVPGDKGRPGLLGFLRVIARDPRQVLTLDNRKWSQRSMIALVMQTRDNSLTVSGRRSRLLGADPEHGVVDPYHRVWGYPSLHITDGSAISANLGVNPALTITAQAERALALWPAAGAADARPAQGQPYARLEPAAPQDRPA